MELISCDFVVNYDEETNKEILCNKKFHNEIYLDIHVKIHTGENIINCNECTFTC